MRFEELKIRDKWAVYTAYMKSPARRRQWRPDSHIRGLMKDLGCEFIKAGRYEGRIRSFPIALEIELKDFLDKEEERMLRESL